MRNFADSAGMIPEQVWDSDAIPEQQLWKGRATHSAMPLAWAHAEYIKLALSTSKDARLTDLRRWWGSAMVARFR